MVRKSALGDNKRMNILFVYTDLFPLLKDWKGYYHVGIASLSAVLQEKGHQTELAHVVEESTGEKLILDKIKTFSPDLVGFSSTTLGFKYVQELSETIRKNHTDILQICGGVHCTLAPDEAIQTPTLDMICVGEGEIVFPQLLDALTENKDHTNIRGIWVKQGDEVYKNGVAPIISDLDEIPFPDRSIFDYPNLVHERTGKAVFMASRGCPYHCSYCSNLTLRKTICGDNTNDYVRFRSVDNIVNEIKKVVAQYDFVTALHFDDDLFFLKQKFAEEFAEKYSKEIGLPFTCNMRPNLLKEKTVKLLKKAGCVEVKIGLENGNEYIRNEILKRSLSDKQMNTAFENCQEEGIKTHSFNMVGIPYETSSTVLDTIKMNARVKADYVQVSIFYPFPKTELYELCKEKGFTSTQTSYDYCHAQLDIKTLSISRVNHFFNNFHLLVGVYKKIYKGSSPFHKFAENCLDLMIKSPLFNLFSTLIKPLRSMKRRSERKTGQMKPALLGHKPV